MRIVKYYRQRSKLKTNNNTKNPSYVHERASVCAIVWVMSNERMHRPGVSAQTYTLAVHCTRSDGFSLFFSVGVSVCMCIVCICVYVCVCQRGN